MSGDKWAMFREIEKKGRGEVSQKDLPLTTVSTVFWNAPAAPWPWIEINTDGLANLVMEWVSDDMNNAVNDGDGGEDDGRPISLVRYMANRDRGWI
ncbi:hypothetical protein WN944_012673 [Citrus x changshan-huyou]|uniref:Uncharacterized protein n=1 Tax=Citrus x changshan-huyou TaxID=2935761 RepID=A0AAP0N0M5_9ROSI